MACVLCFFTGDGPLDVVVDVEGAGGFGGNDMGLGNGGMGGLARGFGG